MSFVLMLANQLARASDLVGHGVQIGSRLGVHGLGCVYMAPPTSCVLPSGVSWGCPELGIPGSPAWITDPVDQRSDHDVDDFLKDVRVQSMISGLDCQTATIGAFETAPLQRVLQQADLIVASSEFADATLSFGLRQLLKLTTRPIVVANRRPWKRVVIAATRLSEMAELQVWANAWSQLWGLEVATIFWTPKARHHLQWLPSTWWPKWEQHVNLPSELRPTDLVLLGRSKGGGVRREMRRAAAWEALIAQCGVSVGIAPLFYTDSVSQILGFSERRIDESVLAS